MYQHSFSVSFTICNRFKQWQVGAGVDLGFSRQRGGGFSEKQAKIGVKKNLFKKDYYLNYYQRGPLGRQGIQSLKGLDPLRPLSMLASGSGGGGGV